MATAELPEHIPWGYLGAFYGGTVIAFACGFAIARAAFDGPFERHAIIGFGAAFGNSVLLGVPVVLTALGDAASLPLFLLLAFHSTLLFTTISLVLEVGGAGRERLRDVPAKAFGGLVRNPILWGLAGGIALNLLGLRLPAALARWTELVAGAAVPCALFSTGASLRSYRIAGACSRRWSWSRSSSWSARSRYGRSPPWCRDAAALGQGGDRARGDAGRRQRLPVQRALPRRRGRKRDRGPLVQHPLARDPLPGARLAHAGQG